MISKYVRLSFLLLLATLMACEDDFRYYAPSEIGDGEGLVAADVAFEDFGEIDLSSRAAGAAIKSINSLNVLIYNTEEELIETKKIERFDIKNTNNNRPDEGIDNPSSAETNTPVATFDMKLKYGVYHIYVIANVDDLDAEWGDSTNYDTVDKLLKLRVSWKKNKYAADGRVIEDNTAKNAQMFGYFSDNENKYGIDYAHSFRSPEPVVVNKPNMKLRAWIRRLASKMTIAFDTRQLKDNVYIYIKSVSLKDVPDSCVLGEDNTPKDYDKDLIHGYDPQEYVLSQYPDYDKDFVRKPTFENETFYFGQANATDIDAKNNYMKWRCLTAGDSIFGYYSEKNGIIDGLTPEKRIQREHGEDVPALYFYENMQGTGKDKKQDCLNDNEIAFPDPDMKNPGTGWKDEKKCGTYMEVEAYYISEDSVRPGRGPIKYRFMLGKNVTTDYNAQRNRHYKLTLQFRGYANDIDWHIDYKEEAKPGFLIPDTVYVSYLYNQSHAFAGRATPKKGYKLKNVEAVILKNEWRPHVAELDNKDNLVSKDVVANPSSVADLYNAESWNMQINKTDYFKDYEGVPTYDTDAKDKDRNKNAPNCSFGYLSLRHVKSVTVEINDDYENLAKMETNTKKLRNYYFLSSENKTNGSLGKRTFDQLPQSPTGPNGMTYGNGVDGTYQVHLEEKQNGEKNYVIMFPLYTRANTIGRWSVYSGANAFYAHERKAYVRYIATYVNEADPKLEYADTAYTTVMQSNRLDNPRGIYRKHDSRSQFHVLLSRNLTQITGGKEYAPIVSHGAWSATIERDPYGLVRLTKGTQMVTGEGSKITGKTGTEVSFTYTPNRIVGKDMAIGAIIVVKYHNNSCIHKIIVRQGYGPVQFDQSGITWSSFNVYDATHVTKSPLAVGSLFRRADNLDNPIAELNNKHWGVGDIPNDKLYIVGDYDKDGKPTMKRKDWSEIKEGVFASGSGTSAAFKEFTDADNGHKYRAPNGDEVLTYNGSQFNPNVNYAFGLVYGEGATTTLDTSDAYGFTDYYNTGANSKKGARGVIAYCLKHGDNVFFPFGQHGHARRKGRDNQNRKEKDGKGVMRYGSLDYKLLGDYGAHNNYRPLAYNLPDQYGAGYWFGAATSGGRISIDFNAGNYMVSSLGVGDLYTRDKLPDALPIKPIRLDP